MSTKLNLALTLKNHKMPDNNKLIFVLTFILLLFFGCTKQDDKEKEFRKDESLIGKQERDSTVNSSIKTNDFYTQSCECNIPGLDSLVMWNNIPFPSLRYFKRDSLNTLLGNKIYITLVPEDSAESILNKIGSHAQSHLDKIKHISVRLGRYKKIPKALSKFKNLVSIEIIGSHLDSGLSMFPNLKYLRISDAVAEINDEYLSLEDVSHIVAEGKSSITINDVVFPKLEVLKVGSVKLNVGLDDFLKKSKCLKIFHLHYYRGKNIIDLSRIDLKEYPCLKEFSMSTEIKNRVTYSQDLPPEWKYHDGFVQTWEWHE